MQPLTAAPQRPANNARLAAPDQPTGTGLDPGASVEIPSARTANTSTYSNPDGTETTRFSSSPMNYRQPDGAWVPVDPTLVPVPAGGWRNRADSVDVRMAARSSDADLVRVGLDAGHTIGFGLSNAASVGGVSSADAVDYPNAFTDTDVQVQSGYGGLKETLVLRSPAAPTTYVFPLRLSGLSPRVDGGQLVLRDSTGEVRATIPPGFMTDSAARPANSEGVTYRLVDSPAGTALEVRLDPAWLHASARQFPVRVDPSVDWSGADSTMVVQGGSSSAGGTALPVGDRSGTASAVYLKFNGLVNSMQYNKIFGAQLGIVDYDSASCSPKPLSVYPVTSSWTAGSGYSYPGPSVGRALASSTFAYGYIALGKSASACPARQSLFDLGSAGRDLVQGWVNGQPNNGLALRASASDPGDWKTIAGAGTANPPTLYVTHTPYYASYAIPRPVPNPPVLQNQDGKIEVTVTNLGAQTWTPSTYYLAYRVFDAKTDKLVAQRRSANLTGNVARNGKATLSATIYAMPPGTYFLDFTMVHVGGPVFTDEQVPPARLVLQVIDIPPVVEELYPPNGYQPPTLTPQLWARALDIDAPPGSTLRFGFQVCEHTDAGANVNCFSSGDLTSQAWTIPAGKLFWSKNYQWQATVKDASNVVTSPWVNLLAVTPQPAITSHLAGAPYATQDKEFDPQTGNLSTAAADAGVAAVGPGLSVVRTYNSLDPRRALAFGAGWATEYDMAVTPDNDGSGNVVVGYADGQQVRFGRNPDGTFAAPPGRVEKLTLSGTTYTLLDSGGVSYQFSGTGRLTRITDANQRSIVLSYSTSNGMLATATVSNSQTNTAGRTLHFAWTGGHVTSVSTDPVNGSPLTWTYTYSGDMLTKVCPPGGGACTTYTYASGSHYRSAVLDSQPESYWRLGEDQGSGASSEVAVNLGKDAGTYHNVTLAAAAGIAGSPDTAASFNGTSSWLELPKGTLKASRDAAIELWFRVSGAQTGGPLIGYQDTALTGSSTSGVPILYVGTDGRLRGQFRTGSIAPLTSPSTVNDNAWHHVVLSLSGSTQTLYLDGAQVGTSTVTLDQSLMTFNQIGAAYASTPGSWPAWGTSATRYFSGSIDDVALYAHPLGPTVVWAHRQLGVQAADQLTQVTLPSGNVAVSATYDTTIDRLKEYTDSNGGTWQIGAPAVYGGDNDLRRSVQVLDPAGRPYLYEYDALAGRLLRSGAPLGLGTREEDLPGAPTASPSPTPSPTQTCTRPDPGDPQFCTILPGDSPDPIFVRQPLDGLAVRSYQYDSHGFPNLVTDENGDTIAITYDSNGNMTSKRTCRKTTECHTEYWTYSSTITNPLDPRTSMPVEHRDARSVSATDNTYRTTFTYTAAGDLLTQTNPDGSFVRHVYTTGTEAAVGGGTVPPGLVSTTTDPRGAITRYGYYTNGDLATVTDPSGLVTTTQYDSLGRKTSEVETSDAFPAGLTTTYGYDTQGRLASTIEPATTDAVTGTTRHQRKTDTTYDADGNPIQTTVRDLLGGDPARTTSTVYDEHDHATQVTNAEGGVTTYGYDRFGNKTFMIDPNGNHYEYAYTARNQIAEVRLFDWHGDPAGAPDTGDYVVLDSYGYDFAGQMVRHTDAMGREVDYQYYQDGLLATATEKNFHNTDGTTRDYVMESDTYDGAGNLTKSVGGNGTETLTQTWNPAGQIGSKTVDPSGVKRVTTFAYDLSGNVTSTTTSGPAVNVPWAVAANAATVAYTYDLSGNMLTETVNPGGTTTAVTSHRYDQLGKEIAQTDPRGNVAGVDPAAYTTTYTYDELGQQTSASGPLIAAESNGDAPATTHPTTLTGYDTFGDAVHARDELGDVVTTAYDRLGRQVTSAGPVYLPPGANATITPTTSTTYDGLGNVTSVTDPRGNVTSMTYDRLNRVTTTDEPATDNNTRAVTTYTYTRTGDVLSTMDSTGAASQATYDDLDRQVTSTQVERRPTANNFTTTYAYDDAGNLVSTLTPGGARSTETYDGAGEPLTTTDPNHDTVTYGYDFAGRQIRQTDGLNRSDSTVYDAVGNVTAASDIAPGGSTIRTVTYGYDAAGNQTSVTDPYNKTTRYQYDAMNHLVQQVEPVTDTHSITTSFGYDAAGNLTRHTDGRGNPSVYTYNSLGLPESAILPSTPSQPALADRTWTRSYDANGNAVRTLAPGNVVRASTYDAANRPTLETGSGASVATASRQLGYDLAGRLTSVSAPGGTDTYTYDDRSNLLTATGPAGNASFSYDADSNMLSRTDAAGASRYTYTGDRLTTQTDALSGVTQTLGYDGAGLISKVDYGSGRVRTFGYDNSGRLASDTLTAGPDGGTVSSITYGYNLNDRLASKVTTGVVGAANNTYTYDQLGRLTSWTANDSTTTYGWDDSGNRIDTNGKTATFDARDRLVSDGDYTYTYTPRGTLASRSNSAATESFAFDAFDRMVGDGSTQYTYDGLDRLATRNGTGLRYDGQETTPTSDGTQQFGLDPTGDLLATKQGSDDVRVDMSDQHGDVVADFDPANMNLISPTDSTTYDPFGDVTASSGPSTSDLGYQGDWTDPQTGQVDMGARWYDSGTGAFDSLDPATYTSGPSTEANGYTYAADDPMTNTDPNGAWPCWSCVGKAIWHPVVSAARWVNNNIIQPAWNWTYNNILRPGWNWLYSHVVAPIWSGLKWVYHKVIQPAWSAVSAGARWVASRASAAVNWAARKAEQARQAAIAEEHRITNAAKAAVAFAIQHNPLPVIAAALKPLYSGFKNVVSSLAHLPAQVVGLVRDVVKDSVNAVTVMYQKAVDTAGVVVSGLSTAAKAVSEFAAAAAPTLAGIGAGLLTTAACIAITGGVGSAGCVVAGFAVGSAVTSALNCPPGRSVVGCAARGGAAGLVAGAVFVGTGGLGGGLAIGALAGGLSAGAASATQQFLDDGQVNLRAVAQSSVVGAVLGGFAGRGGGAADEVAGEPAAGPGGGGAGDVAGRPALPARQGPPSWYARDPKTGEVVLSNVKDPSNSPYWGTRNETGMPSEPVSTYGLPGSDQDWEQNFPKNGSKTKRIVWSLFDLWANRVTG
ncbi:MAG TPA: LamG-like jellyroll fold domain-containing protein [Rugosimonospora sp.]